VHEVDYHLPAFDQVIVKLDLIVFMGEKDANRFQVSPV